MISGSPFGIWEGRLSDISLSGGFVRSSHRPKAMSRIRVTGHSGAREGACGFEIAAFVVRQAQGGFGVEWARFDSDAVRLLILEASPGVVAAPEGPRWGRELLPQSTPGLAGNPGKHESRAQMRE
jgi:PilZ domain